MDQLTRALLRAYLPPSARQNQVDLPNVAHAFAHKTRTKTRHSPSHRREHEPATSADAVARVRVLVLVQAGYHL
jgi:hypothetical protein